MHCRCRTAAASALALLLIAAPAAADPVPPPTVLPPTPASLPTQLVEVDLSRPVQLLSDSVVVTDGGSELHLPPGRYYRENVWATLDTELRRLQTQETRLTAENASLKAALGGWQPGWWTLLTVACGAGAAGWWLHGKL